MLPRAGSLGLTAVGGNVRKRAFFLQEIHNRSIYGRGSSRLHHPPKTVQEKLLICTQINFINNTLDRMTKQNTHGKMLTPGDPPTQGPWEFVIRFCVQFCNSSVGLNYFKI